MRAYVFKGLALCCGLGLAACGETVPEQAIFGAGAGVGTAAVLDGSLAAGAIVGAAGSIAYCQAYPDRCN